MIIMKMVMNSARILIFSVFVFFVGVFYDHKDDEGHDGGGGDSDADGEGRDDDNDDSDDTED